MCDQDGIGVDTSGADRAGAETVTLAARYASIAQDFRTEISLMGQASLNEMPVVSGAEDYCANIVGSLVHLQVHTGALGDNAQDGAGAARAADLQAGAGMGSSYAI